MTENTIPEIYNKKITRREFLKKFRDKALQIGSALLLAPSIGASQSKDEDNITYTPEVYKHTVNNTELYFSQLATKPTGPLISPEGLAFDLSSKKMLPSTECNPEMLLVGNSPAIFGGRDINITEEFANSPVIQEIIEKGNKNVDLWVNRIMSSKSKKISGNSNFDEMNPDLSLTENTDSNFTPSKLLKLRQFVNSISDVLNYDRYSPEKFKELSLVERLKSGYTNCQEFTIATAVILSGEPLNIPSEVFKFDYEIPWQMVGPEKVPIPQKVGHVCNIINFNDTPVVIDTTVFGSGIKTLSDYLSEFSRNGLKITSRIEYSSILSPTSYAPFPWHDSEWINADTPLGINAAAQPATSHTILNNILPIRIN